MRVKQARLVKQGRGKAPAGDGWFVLNARDASWRGNDHFGWHAAFENRKHPFPQYGMNIHVMQKGQPNCHYHGESDQEDFLVVSGRCRLLIEGREMTLGPWDFVHCPSWTDHVFVGLSREPCVMVMAGGRAPKGKIRYPRLELALKYRAGVRKSTNDPRVSYAGIESAFGPAPEPFSRRRAARKTPKRPRGASARGRR